MQAGAGLLCGGEDGSINQSVVRQIMEGKYGILGRSGGEFWEARRTVWANEVMVWGSEQLKRGERSEQRTKSLRKADCRWGYYRC